MRDHGGAAANGRSGGFVGGFGGSKLDLLELDALRLILAAVGENTDPRASFLTDKVDLDGGTSLRGAIVLVLGVVAAIHGHLDPALQRASSLGHAATGPPSMSVP